MIRSNDRERSEPAILKSRIRNPKSKIGLPQASSPKPLARCLAALLPCCLLLLLPAAYAGPPGAVGDLYVTKGAVAQVDQFDGQTGAFVGMFAAGGGLDDAWGLAFAPNGNLFVCSEDNDVVIQYGALGELIGTFASGGGLDKPHGLAFGLNGNLLVASAGSANVLEYDWSSGAFVRVFASGGGLAYPHDLTFGPNGNLFVAEHAGSIIEYDGTTGALIGTFASGAAWGVHYGLAFGGPNENLFVVATHGYYDGRVLEYDGGTGELLRVFAEGPPLEHPYGLTFGPNGNVFVATDCCDTRGVIEYDGASGALLGVFADSYYATWPAFKPAIGSFPQPVISGFSPPQALQCGVLTGATVTGTGLVPWVTVELTKTGEADIVGTVTRMTPDTSMTVEFDLIGAALGLWDLVLTYPDGKLDTLIDAIEIIGCSPPDVTGLDPNQADNCAPLYGATVTGDDFMPGSTVKLVRAGEPDIVGLVTDEDPPTSITVDFSETFGAAASLWDLVVTLPGGGEVGSDTLADALEIIACPPPEVTGIDPAAQDNCTWTDTEATITGNHFLPSATVRLTRPGQPDRVGAVLQVAPDPAATITAAFDLGDAVAGLWDVEADVDGQVATLAGALEVLACPPPLLTGIDAALAFACGERSLYVEGERFAPGATVRLTKAGEADIVASEVTICNMAVEPMPEGLPDMIARCVFDLSPGTAGGFWSVVLTNPDAQSATLPDALEVDPSCPRGAVGHLYVSNTYARNVLQYDSISGELVCVFVANVAAHGGSLSAYPGDLLWAPNGHLWVNTNDPLGGGSLVLEFDGNTGEFIRFVVSPADPIPPGIAVDSLALGGPNGNLFVQADYGIPGHYDTREYERATWAFLGIALDDVPPMDGRLYGKFVSNGNYLVAGSSGMSPVPIIREYDPVTFQLIHEHIGIGSNAFFVEWWDGYYVAERISHQIKRYSLETLEHLDTPIRTSPCFPCGPVELCCFEMMNGPFDVAFGPNGNLFVLANKTPVPCPGCVGGHYPRGAVHEFDPLTGNQIRLIGRQGFRESTTGDWDPQQLNGPEAMEFKPLLGDYAGSGAAFQGDWVIDERDLTHFGSAFSGAGNVQINPHYRLSFDFDRDEDIDCDDWPAFQAAFLASSGTLPELPLPDIPDFVAALLGEPTPAPCFADRNADTLVNGADIEPYVSEMLGG